MSEFPGILTEPRDDPGEWTAMSGCEGPIMKETSNLDRAGKRVRLFLGIIALLLGGTVSAFMLMGDVEPAGRMPVFLLFFMGFISIFQAAAAT